MVHHPLLLTLLILCTLASIVTIALLIESVRHVAKKVPRSAVANHRINTCWMLALYPVSKIEIYLMKYVEFLVAFNCQNPFAIIATEHNLSPLWTLNETHSTLKTTHSNLRLIHYFWVLIRWSVVCIKCVVWRYWGGWRLRRNFDWSSHS